MFYYVRFCRGSVINPGLVQLHSVLSAVVPRTRDMTGAPVVKVDYLLFYDCVLPSVHDPTYSLGF